MPATFSALHISIAGKARSYAVRLSYFVVPACGDRSVGVPLVGTLSLPPHTGHLVLFGSLPTLCGVKILADRATTRVCPTGTQPNAAGRKQKKKQREIIFPLFLFY